MRPSVKSLLDWQGRQPLLSLLPATVFRALPLPRAIDDTPSFLYDSNQLKTCMLVVVHR